MRFIAISGFVSLTSILSGCGDNTKTPSTTDAPSTTDGPATSAGPTGTSGTTGAPVTTFTPRPTIPPTSNCPGRRLGQYTWGTELWRQGSTELSDFFATAAGKDWACGDVTINIGDYTEVTLIAHKEDIVPFIQAYRAASQNFESVVWLSYGDVVSADGSLMETFVDTFFTWAASLSSETVNTLGSIGMSFDVEHMPAASTKSALQKAQSLKASTNFPAGKLLVQHTIEGNPNPDGADYVMKYADSALIMLYRNYMTSPIFNADSNILSRANYFLKDQCVHCLDDAYAAANYQAKITFMVEATCSRTTDYCAKISFCAHDQPGEGAVYLWNTLQALEAAMFDSGLLTPAEFERLFNPLTTFSVHDWGWFRCFAPLPESTSYAQCNNFFAEAEVCRNTIGPAETTPAP